LEVRECGGSTHATFQIPDLTFDKWYKILHDAPGRGGFVVVGGECAFVVVKNCIAIPVAVQDELIELCSANGGGDKGVYVCEIGEGDELWMCRELESDCAAEVECIVRVCSADIEEQRAG
jgi:hypothetical protein